MTLIFSGNDFKYELEGVMKLFIPKKLFKHEFTDKYVNTEGDYAFFRRRIGKRYTLLYVYVKIRDKTYSQAKRILNHTYNYENECELILSRLLFEVMSGLTGKQAKWGIITGIRPVKQVNRLVAEGKSEAEIFNIMRSRYLCTDEKIDIAYKTAKTQSVTLSQLDNKSFSLYVSIPFCPTRCSYCSFVSQSIEGCMNLIPEYVDNVCKEIKYTSTVVKKLGLVLNTIYFGGGTPTTLDADMLDKIMKTISACFDMSKVREYTVEAGRADTITREKLEVLKKNGCDRISINPQTLNDDVLIEIGRKHTVKQFYESYVMARSVGFKCINTDIIAGLPTDTLDSFKNTVDRLIELGAENITVHTLSIKRAARLNQDADESVFDNPASQMVDYATNRLLECGYLPYYLYRQKNMLDNQENIGWSKPGFESLYNIYIMEEVQTIIAMGAGGSTKLVDLNRHELERIFNYKFPLEYNKHFDLMIKKKDGIEAFYAKEK